MPYLIKKFKDGYKVCKKNNIKKCFSNNPIPLENAKKQLKAIGMHSGGNKEKEQYKLLELFKGTGSVGKVAEKMDWDVISVDLEEKYKPDILTDILKWDYKQFYNDTEFIPDFIWASPPCNTFSPLAYPLKERDIETAEPISECAKLGTRILYKTLSIIQYFKKLNPNLLYCLENPHGIMRKDKKIKKLHTTTTLYCLYGDKRQKRTDFFSNFPLELKQDKKCDGETIGVCECDLNNRYKMPPKLVKSILDQMVNNLNKKIGKGIKHSCCNDKNVADNRNVADSRQEPYRHALNPLNLPPDYPDDIVSITSDGSTVQQTSLPSQSLSSAQYSSLGGELDNNTTHRRDNRELIEHLRLENIQLENENDDLRGKIRNLPYIVTPINNRFRFRPAVYSNEQLLLRKQIDENNKKIRINTNALDRIFENRNYTGPVPNSYDDFLTEFYNQ